MIAECRDTLGAEPSRVGKPRSPATVNRYLAALSHAFTVARDEWGWLDDTPMRKVKKPKEPRGRDRYLSNDTIGEDGETIDGERTRLLKACKASSNPYLYPVVVLALSTGMRQGEIMGLTWDDIELQQEQGRITLRETKNGEIRVVPLFNEALAIIQAHAKGRAKAGGLLFPSKTKPGVPIDLRTPWETAVEAAGIEDLRFHDLRHCAASYLAMDGASAAEIAEVLGHKTLHMVKRYAHLSEAHTASVVASMNKKIFG
jgi:integrase